MPDHSALPLNTCSASPRCIQSSGSSSSLAQSSLATTQCGSGSGSALKRV